MTIATIVRGFKVPFSVLDAFLLANDIPEYERLYADTPPFYYEQPDIIPNLLHSKLGGGDTKARIFVPYRAGFESARCAYVAYDWDIVLAQRNLRPEDLWVSPPPAFENLRNEILGYSSMANGESLVTEPQYQNDVFIVITDELNWFSPDWDYDGMDSLPEDL